MHHLVLLTCSANLEFFNKSNGEARYGFEYYAYVLIYVDDVMVINHDAESVLLRIYKYFKLKPSSIGDPDIYLGSKLNKMQLANRVWAWSNSPERYGKELVANVEKYFAELDDVCWYFLK